MSENVDKLPTTQESFPTQKMIDLLKKHGAYKEGMTMQEASDAIEGLPKTNYMKPGIHVVKLLDAKMAEKPDKNGFPGIEFTFANKAGEIIMDRCYYDNKNSPSQCKSEFKLNALKNAFGYKASEEASVAEMKKRKIYLCVGWAQAVNENKEPLVNEEGAPIGFSESIGKFFPFDANKEAPALAGDPALTPSGQPEEKFYREYVKMQAPSATTSSAGSDDTWDDEAPKADAPGKDDTVVENEGGEW